MGQVQRGEALVAGGGEGLFGATQQPADAFVTLVVIAAVEDLVLHGWRNIFA
jgi:hypothetical protein